MFEQIGINTKERYEKILRNEAYPVAFRNFTYINEEDLYRNEKKFRASVDKDKLTSNNTGNSEDKEVLIERVLQKEPVSNIYSNNFQNISNKRLLNSNSSNKLQISNLNSKNDNLNQHSSNVIQPSNNITGRPKSISLAGANHNSLRLNNISSSRSHKNNAVNSNYTGSTVDANTNLFDITGGTIKLNSYNINNLSINNKNNLPSNNINNTKNSTNHNNTNQSNTNSTNSNNKFSNFKYSKKEPNIIASKNGTTHNDFRNRLMHSTYKEKKIISNNNPKLAAKTILIEENIANMDNFSSNLIRNSSGLKYTKPKLTGNIQKNMNDYSSKKLTNSSSTNNIFNKGHSTSNLNGNTNTIEIGSNKYYNKISKEGNMFGTNSNSLNQSNILQKRSGSTIGFRK